MTASLVKGQMKVPGNILNRFQSSDNKNLRFDREPGNDLLSSRGRHE